MGRAFLFIISNFQSFQKFNSSNSGDIYDGNWFKGKLDGFASAKIFGNGAFKEYCGEFRMGKQHGRGKFSWSDGESYEGQWENGLFHGHGIYSTPDGASVCHIFVNGLPEVGSVCQVVDPCSNDEDASCDFVCESASFNKQGKDEIFIHT